MTSYTDVFVLPVADKNIDAYRKLTVTFGQLCREHGALSYVSYIGEDVKPGKLTSFPQAVKLEAGETVVVGVITYRSRAHRDQVDAAVWSDPRAAALMAPDNSLFDGKRMFFGGFDELVSL